MVIKEQPIVTIILPTYNRKDFLERSITSVVNQTYKNWELLIIDDGSSDDTFAFAKKYVNKFPRIRYFFHENRGAAYSMNIGIQNSRGNYITFLGSDDKYELNHVKLRVKYMSENRNVDLIHSHAKIVGNEFVKDKNDLSKNIHLDECILGGTIFGKSEIFKKLDGFVELKYSPESEFIERAKKDYKIKLFDFRTYIYYRDTPDGICNNVIS